MNERSVVHDTFVIERSYPAAPARVFAAFADPAKKRLWFAEGDGFVVEAFDADFRVGGSELTRFRMVGGGLPDGTSGENDTHYQDIVPDRRIVLAYTMTIGGKRISSSQATVELLPAKQGTTLVFTEQAAFFEGGDGAQMREAGWRELFEKLAKSLAH